MKSVLPKLMKTTSKKKKKIKWLEEGIENLKNENTTLRENILINLKLRKICPVTTKEKRQSFPSKKRPNKIATLTRINLTGRLPIPLKYQQMTQGQKLFTLKPAINSLHCRWNMKMISQHANQQIQHLPIQRSPIKSQFSNNDKSLSDFERKRRPDVCVAENYIQNFITVKIPGKSNYNSFSKNGCRR